MESGSGAYGGGFSGGTFDPIKFVQRPQVILRAFCWLFSIVVFGCISSQGWMVKNGKDVCLYNEDAMACKYGTTIGVIGFLASMVFLAGEYLFEKMSSVKTRKHYVLADLIFSGFWSFKFFIVFIYLWSKWSAATAPPSGYGVNNVQAAIVFSFFSIFTWGACAFLAWKRYQIGAETAFASTFEQDPQMYNQNQFNAYPDNSQQQYSQQPFTQEIGQTQEYSQPTY